MLNLTKLADRVAFVTITCSLFILALVILSMPDIVIKWAGVLHIILVLGTVVHQAVSDNSYIIPTSVRNFFKKNKVKKSVEKVDPTPKEEKPHLFNDTYTNI